VLTKSRATLDQLVETVQALLEPETGKLMAKILYVDDEADIRDVAQMSLELDPEFDVRTCSSGRQASPLPPSGCPIYPARRDDAGDGRADDTAGVRDQPATADVPSSSSPPSRRRGSARRCFAPAPKGSSPSPSTHGARRVGKAHLPQ
jgi:hypothetical protein